MSEAGQHVTHIGGDSMNRAVIKVMKEYTEGEVKNLYEELMMHIDIVREYMKEEGKILEPALIDAITAATKLLAAAREVKAYERVM